MKKIVNSLFVLVFGLGLVSGGMVNVGATGEPKLPEKKETTATVNFKEGLLQIISDDSEISFGGTDTSITTEGKFKSNEDLQVKLKDERGINKKWYLTAKLSNFTQDEVTTLSGSTITLNDGILTNEPFEVSSGIEFITLESNLEKEITFREGKNTGEWLLKWEEDNIELNVPINAAQAGMHEATITWNLRDARQ